MEYWGEIVPSIGICTIIKRVRRMHYEIRKTEMIERMRAIEKESE